MPRSTVLIATRNAEKVRELIPLVPVSLFDVVTLAEIRVAFDPAEDALEQFDTFEANALAKARFFFERLDFDYVLADDSGLSVEALHGAPGVRSKRWTGRDDLSGAALDAHNNQMLLQALIDVGAVDERDRAAQYVCAAAAAWRGGSFVAIESTKGRIVTTPRGQFGFGYDPYFHSSELGDTFASVSLEAKARVSHRGRAFRALVRGLERIRA